jgi:hypothetical protein
MYRHEIEEFPVTGGSVSRYNSTAQFQLLLCTVVALTTFEIWKGDTLDSSK